MKLRLSRITDGKKIISEIEGLRFISILLVVLSHINNNLLGVYPQSYQSLSGTPFAVFLEECGAGVNIFFFISGFILAIPFLKAYVYDEKKISLRRYYYRRLTRIEPPYIISLLFFFLIAILVLDQPFLYALEHFTASIFYMHNIIYNHISTINPVAWTLEIEIQYYIIFPLIAVALFFKNHLLRRLCLITLFLLTGTLYAQNFSFFNKYSLTKSLFAPFSLFIAGIIVADLYLAGKSFFTGTKNFLFDVPGFATLYFIITLSGFQGFGYRIFVFICYFILFTSIFKGKFLNKIFTNKWVVIIGGMCYSIYLLHYGITYFIIQTFTKNFISYNHPRDFFIQSILIIPIILVISIIFFILLERPFMNINWPNKLKSFFQKNF
ncbi:MAG: acyltransferase [Parafilimonas sp.]